VGAPTPLVSAIQVKAADAPKLLEYSWGEQDSAGSLEADRRRRHRLTLWHNIDRRFISMGAAGLAHLLSTCWIGFLEGHPIGRRVGPETMKFGGWQRLNAE